MTFRESSVKNRTLVTTGLNSTVVAPVITTRLLLVDPSGDPGRRSSHEPIALRERAGLWHMAVLH